MIAQRFLQTYAVPKRMYKKDGSVGQSEKYSGLNEKKLSLMKGDKVVEGIKQLSDFALFLTRRKRYFSHTELVVIEVQTNATLLQLHNQLLKIR